MPIALLRFYLMGPLMMPLAVVLSTLNRVHGCGCPNSLHAIHKGTRSWEFMNEAAASASAADATSILTILADE